jgi:intein/homing endonuclease
LWKRLPEAGGRSRREPAIADHDRRSRLPIDPYVLGAWLGDGTTGSSLIAHAQSDVEVVGEIEARGFVVSDRYVQDGTGVAYARFGSGRPNVRSPMTAALYAAGVLFRKHVPEAYLRSSIGQRLELLAGLIDTDGTVDGTGRVKFSTASDPLRDGVVDLAKRRVAKIATE